MLYGYKGLLPQLGKDVFIAPTASVVGDVEIAQDCSIWFGTVIRGDVHYIKIGKRTSVQDLSMVHVTHFKNGDKSTGHPTIIGDDVTIGHKVMLHGCQIKDRVLVGMGATILDGAVIGSDSIIAAGALVTKNKKFPPKSLIMGAPAKVIRALSDEEIVELKKSAVRYVEFKNEYLGKNSPSQQID